MPEKRGALEQYDDTSKLAVSLYGKASAVGDTAVGVESLTNPNLRVALFAGATQAGTAQGNADSLSQNVRGLTTTALLRQFNDSSWDRWRNNTEATLLASAARTSTTNSSDQTNYNARGVIAFLDVTAVPGVDTVTLVIQGKDPVSGNYRTLAMSAAKDATGTYYVVCYPGAADDGNRGDGNNDFPLPRTWRVQVTHSGSGSFTYSVGASLIL